MTPDDNDPLPELTPEQKAAVYAEMQKTFTADDLYGYIEDTGERFPAEQVLEEMEGIVRDTRAKGRSLDR